MTPPARTRCCRVRRVSADRAARPGPHTRGKPRLLDLGTRIPARDRFAPDSPLEGTGFELPVPRAVQERPNATIAGFSRLPPLPDKPRLLSADITEGGP